MAEEMKIISKTGAWYSFGDTRIGQGRENAKDFLVKNPDVFSEVALKVKTKLGMIKTTDTAEEKPDQKEKAAGNEREKAAGRGK